MAVSETHDLGRLYCHGLRVPAGTPRLQLDGQSYEVEEPWRVGRAVVVRVTRTWAAVVGVWGRPRTLEEVQAEEAAAEDELAGDTTVSLDEIRRDFRQQPLPERRHPLYEVR